MAGNLSRAFYLLEASSEAQSNTHHVSLFFVFFFNIVKVSPFGAWGNGKHL